MNAVLAPPDQAVQAEPAVTAIVRDALEGAIWVPTNLLRRNPWNRTRFNGKAMTELAGSVKKHGVMQPLVVRTAADAKAGGALYEIVAGERRWIACGMAGVERLPALLRTLSDIEVIELMTIENVQRESLHPLDEANNFKELLSKYTLEELAERVDKSQSHVYQRLQLLKLSAEGQEALLADKLHTSLAVEVARLPNPADQAEAVAQLVAGWGGEPFTVRAGKELLRTRFMLRLAAAPFDTAATYPTAGPCGSCPKRTGAHPGLFDEDTVGEADMCQDRACFQAKVGDAHHAELQAAIAAGHTVVAGDKAVQLLPNPQGGQPVSGYHFFDQPCPALTDSKRPLRELLGLNFRGALALDHPATQTIFMLVADDKARRALKTKNLLREATPPKRVPDSSATPAPAPAPATPTRPTVAAKPEPTKPMSPRELADARQHRAAQLFGSRLMRHLHANLQQGELPVLGLRLAVGELLMDSSNEGVQAVYEACDWPFPSAPNIYQDLRSRIQQADSRLLGELLILATVCEELTNATPLSEMHEGMAVQLADAMGIDLKAIDRDATDQAELELQAEQARRRGVKPEQATPETALAAAMKSAKSKPAKARQAPAVKYRDAATGATWTGRGLKPRWLVAALAAGKQLGDFEVSNQAPA